MLRVVRGLKKGIDYDLLDERKKIIFNELEDAGIIFNSHYKGKNIYKLSNNVGMHYNKEQATFEVFPNRVIGAFFDYDTVFDCVSEGKEAPKSYFMAYALNPDKEIVESFDLGNNIKVKVIARGYNAGNEGLLVRLPSREMDFFNMNGKPCITIGLSSNAKSKDTGMLIFDEEIDYSKFIEGRKGIIINGKTYFNIKDIKETSTVYNLNYKGSKYSLKKKEDKKLYNR